MAATSTDDMTLFLAIVAAGSLSQAARLLGLSPASVSERLSGLERRLGSQLLHRTTRNLRLTPEGSIYHEHAQHLVAALNDAEEAVAAAANRAAAPVRGALRISAPIDLGRRYVAPAVTSFAQRYPETRIHLSLSDRVVDIVGEDFDLAVRYGSMPDSSSLVARPLAPNRRLICGAPAYFDLHGRPASPADLGRHNCLVLSRPGARLDAWAFARGETITAAGDRDSDDGAVLRDWAIAGVGLVLKSYWAVADDLRAGRLEAVLAEQMPTTHELRIVRPRSRLLPARIELFIAHLIEAFAREPAPPWLA